MSVENRPYVEMQGSKEKIGAASLAQEKFQRVMTQYTDLHDDLLALRSYDPQRRIESDTKNVRESVPAYLSPDERRYMGGYERYVSLTRDYVVTRGRKVANRGKGSIEHEQVKTQDVEAVSNALEKSLSQELTYHLEEARGYWMHELSDDEMKQGFQKQWQESLDELTTSDQQRVTDSERTWHVYEDAHNSLLSLLPQIDDLAEKFHQLGLRGLSPPINSRLTPEYLSDSSEKGTQVLLQKLSESKDYIAKVESMIAAEIERRQLQKVADELRAKTAAEMAEQIRQHDIERYGVTGGLLEVARALAEVATKKMGEQEAISFFDEVENKPYGRQRRMNDVEARLGDSLSYEAGKILNLRRASDFDATIFATKQVLLESQSLSKKTKQNGEAQMNEDEPMETEMARKLKAAMASLK